MHFRRWGSIRHAPCWVMLDVPDVVKHVEFDAGPLCCFGRTGAVPSSSMQLSLQMVVASASCLQRFSLLVATSISSGALELDSGWSRC